jgi:hypothetical protein
MVGITAPFRSWFKCFGFPVVDAIEM